MQLGGKQVCLHHLKTVICLHDCLQEPLMPFKLMFEKCFKNSVLSAYFKKSIL